MNFTKYASALALFATAASTTATTTDGTTASTYVAVTGDQLKDALKACIEGKKDNNAEDYMTKCLKDKGINDNAIEKLKLQGYKELTVDEANSIATEVNQEISAAEKKSKNKDGNWYDCLNNGYGYAAAAFISFGLIGGGIYMAVGRKNEDADL